MTPIARSYDVIVVGAGATGCVLASRLSEHADRSVLLVEAGPYFGPIDRFPEEMRRTDSYQSVLEPDHPNNWSYRAALTNDRVVPMPRGKVVGGSSAINGTLMTRGVPEDYNRWAAGGNDQWSFEQVLPYFVRLETDVDCHGDYHGLDGPIQVQRFSALSPCAEAFVQSCTEFGFPADDDMNAPGSIGVGLLPQSQIAGVRMNAAVTYLEPAATRPNLTVLDATLTKRVLFDDKRAVGIEAEHLGQAMIFEADEVVLCAGAVNSPHLLMLSGIGPADALRHEGIPFVHDAQFVGKNFEDHPMLTLPYAIEGPTRRPRGESISQVGLHYTSTDSRFPNDLSLHPSSYSRMPAVGTFAPVRKEARGESDLSFSCRIGLPESKGEIALVSTDPSIAPEIHYHYLSGGADRRRMREVVRLAVALLRSDSFQKLGAAQSALDDGDLSSDGTLDRWISSHIETTCHLSGSCRMGNSADPSAVVDQFGRVHGVESLRVLDISIMPQITSRGPYATSLMIGERAASFFR